MIEQITLTACYINDKSKDGKAFITKTGKAYKKIAIKCKEHGNESGEVYIYGNIFNDNDPRLNWKRGDSVSAVITQNGQWWNVDVPDKEDYLEERIKRLEDRVFGETPEVQKVDTEKSVLDDDRDIPF